MKSQRELDHQNLINEISDIAKDICQYLENTPHYQSVSAYFFDRLNYVHKTKEWVDPYPTVDYGDVMKVRHLTVIK